MRALQVELLAEACLEHCATQEVHESELTTISGRTIRLLEQFSDQFGLQRLAQDRYHNSIACHAVVAAVRGGRLKRLCPGFSVDLPFAVRALLPYWLQIEDWGLATYAGDRRWSAAASSLRPCLAHASRRQDWLAPTSNPMLELLVACSRSRTPRLCTRTTNLGRTWAIGATASRTSLSSSIIYLGSWKTQSWLSRFSMSGTTLWIEARRTKSSVLVEFAGHHRAGIECRGRGGVRMCQLGMELCLGSASSSNDKFSCVRRFCWSVQLLKASHWVSKAE